MAGVFIVQGPTPTAVERLKDEGIVIRDLPYPEAVRASVHAVNTEAEVDELLASLDPEW